MESTPIPGTRSRYTDDGDSARVYDTRAAANVAKKRLEIVASEVCVIPSGSFGFRVRGRILGQGTVWHE